MKFIDEYRDSKPADIIAGKIAAVVKGKWKIMEVCGSQTHTIMKYNLEQLLPEGIELIHGPGCPVCVTPADIIDKAIKISEEKNTVIATYGDMLRVPGSSGSLSDAKRGNNIRIIYSPLDAVRLAESNPDKIIIFLAVGFETTAPGNAKAVLTAVNKNFKNFFLLTSQVLIPPAIKFILNSGISGIQGLLAPGHVCTITGYDAYEELAVQFHIPITVTGFEPLDILEGIYLIVRQLEEGSNVVKNQYKRVVLKEGNKHALNDMYKVFEAADFNWRGIGVIKNSGLILKQEFDYLNAERFYGFTGNNILHQNDCIAGEILQGLKKPFSCPLFNITCTPENPVGAPMVSAEGICSAYFHYKDIGYYAGQ